ncbi:MAG: PIN domain-containing protein [Clostridiales Family XIII bacterium]|jgi:uncharacterized protein YacL|nr:PIN domain-containing protein [Clostridiales Family XIII bacterium]
MIKRVIRGGITLLGAVFGYGVYLLFLYVAPQIAIIDIDNWTQLHKSILAIVLAIIFGILFFILTPLFQKVSSRVAHSVENEIKHLAWQDLLSGTIGLIMGLIIASLISLAFAGIENSYLRVAFTILTYIIFIWLGVVVGGRRGREMIRSVGAMRRSIIGRGGKPKSGGDATPKILDTSVIIDGRIADIMKTGFIEGNIVIPEFVLVELRHIADSSDGLKRNRGRRGLDILNKIQTEYGIQIYNTDSEKALEDIPEVDVKLLKLAQIMNGKVVTNDFNLNKVAVIKGVEVLNINELANTLKPVVLPGEEMTLFLVKEGKEQGQAVAYLDDGTMIVVEDGKRYIGQTIAVVVSSVLQTSAGRMIFARTKQGAR